MERTRSSGGPGLLGVVVVVARSGSGWTETGEPMELSIPNWSPTRTVEDLCSRRVVTKLVLKMSGSTKGRSTSSVSEALSLSVRLRV